MWFKNLLIYRFSSPFTLDLETLEAQLEVQAFVPCGKRDTSKYGWVSPMGEHGDQFAHTAANKTLLCARREEKIIPASVIRELVDKKAAEIEAKENRQVFRKEKDALKEEVMFDCLPQAFSRSSKTYAYIDPKAGWFIVDAASAKKAEDLCSLLRDSLGSLPVVPAQTSESPSVIMTSWLRGEDAPAKLDILDECEMREPGEDGGIIRCKRQDLFGDEVSSHLDNGKLVHKLAVEWDDQLKLLLNDDLSIKRLKFCEALLAEAEDAGSEDPAAKLDADFALMCATLTDFLPQLMNYFGGNKADPI